MIPAQQAPTESPGSVTTHKQYRYDSLPSIPSATEHPCHVDGTTIPDDWNIHHGMHALHDDESYRAADWSLPMSSSGRAASASAARRAKQELERLLFPSRPLALNTYRALKKAYLARLHDLHPDKAEDAETGKRQFVELQTAWMVYERMSRTYRQASADRDGAEGDFTMFGVGCSFADNDQERKLRTEIMDQACRGWFSSGLLQESSAEPSTADDRTPNSSLFTQLEEELETGPDDNPKDEPSLRGTPTSSPQQPGRKTLVHGLRPLGKQ